MYGITVRVRTSPRDLNIVSFPNQNSIAAGVTAIINFINQHKCIARSILVINRDTVNNATINLNGDTNNPITVSPGVGMPFNDMWIEQVRGIAGAAGALDILQELVPLESIQFGSQRR